MRIFKKNITLDNVDLYKRSIDGGISPQRLKDILKQLETQKNPHKIEIKNLPGYKRRMKGFYIDHKYFKEGERRISITLKLGG